MSTYNIKIDVYSFLLLWRSSSGFPLSCDSVGIFQEALLWTRPFRSSSRSSWAVHNLLWLGRTSTFALVIDNPLVVELMVGIDRRGLEDMERALDNPRLVPTAINV